MNSKTQAVIIRDMLEAKLDNLESEAMYTAKQAGFDVEMTTTGLALTPTTKELQHG